MILPQIIQPSKSRWSVELPIRTLMEILRLLLQPITERYGRYWKQSATTQMHGLELSPSINPRMGGTPIGPSTTITLVHRMLTTSSLRPKTSSRTPFIQENAVASILRSTCRSIRTNTPLSMALKNLDSLGLMIGLKSDTC
jgi:hypothetical protein